MKGSVFQDRKSGHWCVQIRFNGKTERFYRYQYKESWFAFESKGHARKVLSVIQDEIDNHRFNPAAYRPNSPLAIKQYVDEWLPLADVIKNTLKRYKSYSKLFIECFGENKDIRKITKIDILKLKKWLEESGYSPKTTKHVLATLKTVMFFALDNRDITFMPSFPKLPNIIKTNIDYLKKDLQDQVLQAIPERHRPIFELMAEYGLRIQEGRALMKDAVTDTHIIIMRRFSEYTLLEGDKVGKFRPFIKTTKAKEILKRTPVSFSDFVFTHNGRSPYDEKILNKLWKDACASVGVNIRLYNGMRHSKAGQLLDAGFSMDVVSAILGHSKIQMTKDMYGRVSETRINDVLESMGKVISLTDNSPTKIQEGNC